MNTDLQHGWRFLRSRRWLGYFAMLIVFSITCVWLGNWQFERRAEARAEIARIDANYDAAPVALSDVIIDPASFNEDAHKWQQVELTGEYIGDTFLARNRPGPQGVGSNLINAFRNEDGAVIFIDRGWVAVSGTDEVAADLPAPPSGEVSVTARMRATEPTIQGRSSVGNSVASINIPELARLSEARGDVVTSAYGQLVAETPSGETGVLAERPERDEGPHLSYALQWYVFILIACIGVVYAARQEYRGLNAEGASVKREDARRAERKLRRGPSDAEEEDALLS
jgi:cytochrome oxidase assembly protein ShyY1